LRARRHSQQTMRVVKYAHNSKVRVCDPCAEKLQAEFE
jgi:hypothetical protein